jgi:hypothetical protein
MTIEQLTIILLILGLIPLQISRRIVRGKSYQIEWQILATFWRLTVNRPSKGRVTWRFTMPVIERLASAIWAALSDLVK